jgi:hypothetical protein
MRLPADVTGVHYRETCKNGSESGGLILRLEESQFIEFQTIIRYFPLDFCC